MESISYQIADVLELMRQVSGVEITELRVDGGPTANRFLMQFQADIARVQVVRTEVPELSAMGAAYMSGLATGVWSWADLDALPFEKQAFRPEMERGERDRLYREWKRNLAEMVGVADRTLSVPLQ
jgi:glycerol kinase